MKTVLVITHGDIAAFVFVVLLVLFAITMAIAGRREDRKRRKLQAEQLRRERGGS